MNIITFTFKTEAPYSDDELDALNSELAATVKEIDDDAVGASFDTNIADESASDAEDEVIRVKAAELLAKGGIRVSVAFDDDEGTQLWSSDLKTLSTEF